MKAMVGSSVLDNSFAAGVETAKNATKGIKNPKVGILFTSVKYDQDEVIKGIKSVNSDMKSGDWFLVISSIPQTSIWCLRIISNT